MAWIVRRSDELYHHGILGQKWGCRNGPPYPLNSEISRVEKGDRLYNTGSFGKKKETNCLYLTGLSGSGKSVSAEKLANSNTEIISLDPYFGEPYGSTNKSFDKWRNANGSSDVMKDIQKYAESVFPNKNVIAEGVEIFDGTVSYKYFKDKPVYVKGNDFQEVLSRFGKRYLEENGSKEYYNSIMNKNTDEAKEWTEWYIENESRLNAFEDFCSGS